MSNEAIIVKDVSMRFNLSRERVDNAKEYFVKKLKKQLSFDEFYALRNVSFSVEKGDAFAIIGENGCGKSTLLKAISGIYYPSTGSVKVEGTISPLIELGAGFDMDLTARENIYLNGAVLGRSKEFINEHFNEIMDFAELWDFVDVPLKNFSSGMVARLGFSIATVTVPDILIVDEILAVGDINFQRKCQEKMQQMLSGGTTLLFVSHDINQIKSLCRHAIWLNHGIVQMIGDAETVADAYTKDMIENGGKGIVHLEDIMPKEEEQKDEPATQTAAAETVKTRKNYSFIRWLRAFAALLVAYHHSIQVQFTQMGLHNKLTDFVSNHILAPFGLDLGYLGVVIFFAVSGFLVIDSLRNNSSLGFIKKKIVRLFPPLFIALIFFRLSSLAVTWLTETPAYWEQFTLWEWIQSATLIGHFTGVSEKVIGITWFLVPLVMYYLLCAVFKPLLKLSPIAFTCAILAVSAMFTFGFSHFGGMWFMVANYMQHIPLILFGQIIFLYSEKKVNAAHAGILFVVNFFVLMQNIRLFFPDMYTGAAGIKSISVIIGIVIFAAAFVLREKLSDNIAIKSVDKISYPLYLSHYQVAQLFVPILIVMFDYSVGLTLFATAVGIFAVAIAETFIANAISKLFNSIKRRILNCFIT